MPVWLSRTPMNFGHGTNTLIFFCIIGILPAGQLDSTLPAPADSLFFTGNDTLITDSTAVTDTVKVKKKADLEGPIYYWADTVSVSRSENIIYLSGKAKIKYQNCENWSCANCQPEIKVTTAK